MSLDKLLSCLEKVKRTGQGRFIACCPAHADKSPSLAIRELDDGRLLIHCFGGCDTQEVLGSLGMTFADLMPEPKGNHLKGERRPFAGADVLRCLSFESLIVMVAAKSMGNKEPLSDEDCNRLMKSVETIQAGITASGINYEH